MDQALLLWPGMGADARMYAPLAAHLALPVPAWAEPRGTLADHARAIVDAGAVPRGAIVGGSSFGGMLALEVARIARARAVVLIGSARGRSALAPWLLAAAPFARALPDAPPPAALMRLAGGVAFGLRRARGGALFADMARATPAAFLRWACAAAAAWPSVGDPGCPVVRVHGARDLPMPASRAHGATIIRGAGHLCALTHPRAVADAIRGRLREALRG